MRLNERLRDTELDLDDATTSRRELQQRIQKYESQIQYMTNQNDGLKIDNDGLKVDLGLYPALLASED